MLSATAIGQTIKTLREKRNMTREAFCSEVGITVSALSNYENGIRIPRDEVKLRIARCLGTSIESIFFEE